MKLCPATASEPGVALETSDRRLEGGDHHHEVVDLVDAVCMRDEDFGRLVASQVGWRSGDGIEPEKLIVVTGERPLADGGFVVSAAFFETNADRSDLYDRAGFVDSEPELSEFAAGRAAIVDAQQKFLKVCHVGDNR